MRVIETTVFTYAELNDKAKANARDWYREASQGDNYFAESVIEDAVTIAGLMGIEIDTRANGKNKTPCVDWSGFWSQGDGASFVGVFDPKAFNGPAVLAHAPQDEKLHAVAADLSEASQGIPGEWRARITKSEFRYAHSYTMQIDIEQETDENGDAPQISAESEKALLGALRAYAQWIYRQLESAYDDFNSDESVADVITANEYEFKADGSRACV